uniref:No apical meristem-associated C-terminal domain-containing protein n=1 Tax=Oryza glaberrima TaxID=4538 RepID=I1Q620_ORYGL
MEEEGFYTNLMNEGNDSLDWDSLSSMPVEDDMSNQLDENGMSSEPVMQQFPTAERTTVARPNQKRSKNFSEQEDKILVSAWLHIAQAIAVFKELEGKPFQFLHCWSLLRSQSKWHDKMKQIASQKPCATNRQKPSTDGSAKATPTNDETTNHVGEDNEPTETEEPKRPMGKKRAKEHLRRGETCTDAFDHLWEKKKKLMQRRRREMRGTKSHMN